MKKIAASLFAVLALAFASVANATPIQWTLSGATLSDSSTLSGSFFYDADSNTYSAWSLSVTAGTLPAFVYNPADSSVLGLSSASELWVFNSARGLNLNFVAPLTSAGGDIALDLAKAFTNIHVGSWENNNNAVSLTYRWLTAGSVTTTSVPEPTSIALLGLALVGIVVTRRKRAR